MNLEPFFTFVAERESIRRKREAGLPWPWTEDQTLRDGFFCNVFREDDRVTRWFRHHLRGPASEDLIQAVQVCIGFRWFNKPETGELLKDLLLGSWDAEEAISRLRPVALSGSPIFSGAYIISSPTYPKYAYVCHGITRALELTGEILAETTLEGAHSVLKQVHGIGKFMAYEVVTDLRHTSVLRDAPDIMTWASPGPGCARGLSRILYGTPKGMLSYGNRSDRQLMHDTMLHILDASRQQWKGARWEMRDVEHCLCEFDKYRRVLDGGRAKRRYRRPV